MSELNQTLTDTTGQLPQVGSDIGSFLTNLAPGVVAFVFVLAVVGGIIGLLSAVIFVIRSSMSNLGMSKGGKGKKK